MSKKILLVLSMIVLITCLVVGSFFLGKNLNQKEANNQQVNSQTTTQTKSNKDKVTTPTTATPQQIIAKAKSKMTDLFAKIAADLKLQYKCTDNPATDDYNNKVAGQLSGYKFGLNLTVSCSIREAVPQLNNKQARSTKIAEMEQQWRNVLNKHGLVAGLYNPGDDSRRINVVGDNLVCQLSITDSGNYKNGNYFGCVERERFEAVYQTYAPIVADYLAKNQRVFYFTPDHNIVNTSTPGYAHTIVGTTASTVGGWNSLFYKTPDNKWHYFKGGQQHIACSEFNTPTLKAAFEGMECYDTKQNKTLKVTK